MKHIKTYIVALGLFIFGAALTVPALEAHAYNPLDSACRGSSANEVCKNKNEKVEPVITTVVNTLLFVVGVLSVIMIIAAGIMYTISGGDTGRVVKAKNMLIYAIVGLVISFLAYAILNWVTGLL